MSMLDSKWVIGLGCIVVKVVGNNIFTNSLIGATMQDSSKRERSNWYIVLQQMVCSYLNLTDIT